MPVGFEQLINGLAWDFSSVQITIETPAPMFITRIQSITYEHGLAPGEVRGTSAQKLMRTRGQYTSQGSMSLYREEYDILLRALKLAPLPSPAHGYMEKAFKITVMYGEESSAPTVDTLMGCRITRDSANNQVGGDPSMIDVDLDIMQILRGGIAAVRGRHGAV